MIVDALSEIAINGYPAGYFAPTYKMMSEVWREMSDTLRPIAARISSQEHRIELITGGVVDMWSLDVPDVARGRKYKRVAIDEAGMVSNLEAAWQQVIRPTLADLEGDAWFLGTPKGRNYFHTIFQWGKDDERTDWRSWQLPTRANPHIKPVEIEAMRREMPERSFAQEILAEFLEDGGGLFRNVRRAAIGEPLDKAQDGGEYVAGLDWARVTDYTVLTIFDVRNRREVFKDRFNQIGYNVQRDRIKAACKRFNVGAVIAEANSMGGPNIEQLQYDGLPVIPFTTTNASKAMIIDALALAFEQDAITILNHDAAVAELEAFEQTRLPGGMMRYAAPDGMHDDCVISMALAWWGVIAANAPSVPSMMIYDEPISISPY